MKGNPTAVPILTASSVAITEGIGKRNRPLCACLLLGIFRFEPVGQGRGLAFDEILALAALVDPVIRKGADADRAVERPGAQERRNQRAVDRIVDGELTLPVLIRLAAGGENFNIDLGIAGNLGIEGACQVTGQDLGG